MALGRPALRIAIDDFHLPRAERWERSADDPSWLRYYEHTFDHPGIRAALLPLGLGGDRRHRRAIFDSLRDRSIAQPALFATPDAVMPPDGVFLQHPEPDDLRDVRLFVAIDIADSLRRDPARDRAWLGACEAGIPAYHDRYIPGEDRYIGLIGPAERADIVADNRDPARPILRSRTT